MDIFVEPLFLQHCNIDQGRRQPIVEEVGGVCDLCCRHHGTVNSAAQISDLLLIELKRV
jgi:hypothetical protein